MIPGRFDRDDGSGDAGAGEGARARAGHPARPRASNLAAAWPQSVALAERDGVETNPYLDDPVTRKLVEFFDAKGLDVLKREDQRQQWYADWLAYQAEHRIYASLLSPAEFSALGNTFDLLRYARFLEVVGYLSPAHGYSLQVTFLGLFSVLMGSNRELKREAVAALESGAVLALGVSEQAHGSDLLANEFTVAELHSGRFVANGTKYYIGNSNVAAMISILGREGSTTSGGRARRAAPVLVALRPNLSPGFKNLRKIRTLGVRAAYVGEFEVRDHQLPATDIIARGREAWDAVFGTVTLGKFFLGFGSIGICEHALLEARDHLRGRILYGKPAITMPHMRAMMVQSYARLTAMKLYAYRALDYVHTANLQDRRYLLFCAVQKAKVSTEGVRVVASLSECVGAKGFEADTYIEMALRDVQLIPGLEGSAHINLALAAQFIARYFGDCDETLAQPPSLIASEVASTENPYLMTARSTGTATIAFPRFLRACAPLLHIANVRRFARQARAFRRLVRRGDGPQRFDLNDTQLALALGQCLAMIAYAQLIAENACRLDLPPPMISAIFHLVVTDLSVAALTLEALPQLELADRTRVRRMVSVPRAVPADWDAVGALMEAL